MGWVFLIGSILIVIIFISSESKTKANIVRYDDMIKERFNVPQDVSSVDYGFKQEMEEIQKSLLGKTPHRDRGFYIWRVGNNIEIVNKPSNIEIMKEEYFVKLLDTVKKIYLNINNIEYYHLTGQKIAVTTGSGGGTSLTGAIIGNEIAGVGGAIIGGRKKTTISTEIVDDRCTMIVYSNPETNNIEHMAFPSGAYDILMNIIPSKELGYIKSKIK